MKDRKECGNCALYNYQQQGCIRTQTHQQPNDYCSSFIRELPVCEMCGQMFIPPSVYVIDPDEDKLVLACGSCASGLGTCRTCVNSKYCDFQQNPINLPPMVQKTMQQGNMYVSQTVINPARVAETCAKNCPCWDEEDKACNRNDCGLCGTGYKPSYLP